MYIIIIGCRSLGRILAEHLIAEKHEIVIIEKDEEIAKKLAEETDALIINGDGSDTDILKDAGIERADAVAILTDDDNTNLTICQMVKKFNVGRIVAMVNDPAKEDLYLGLNISAAISPLSTSVPYFKNSITETEGRSIISIAKGKGEILELTASKKLNGKKIKDIELPSGALIGLILRDGEVIIAHQDEIIKKNDLLVVITKSNVARDVITALKE